MHRQLVLRPTRPPVCPGAFRRPIVYRKLTTPPPTSQGKSAPGQSGPTRPGDSNTLIILSALGALGGLYYYYTHGQPAADREAARRKEEELERKVKEVGEAGKNKAESAVKQGQRDLGEVKDAVTAARSRATEAGTDLAGRARQSAHDAQAKLGDLKSAAEEKMSNVRDQSERNFEEVTPYAREPEKRTRSWFGWGSSK